MAAGSAGEGAGSNTELRWTFSRLACQSEMELARVFPREKTSAGGNKSQSCQKL